MNMLNSMGGPRPRLNVPEAIIITVIVLVVTVLAVKGMKPADAVLVVFCAGLSGAVVVRCCTTGRLTALLRPAWDELQATPA
jgi:hypothetical protein